MAWVEFHQALPRHPKTLRVAAALGIPRAQVCGHLATLWCWALDARPDGGPLDRIDVLAGAEWEGRKDFTGALVEAGFLDEREDGLWLHDWHDYAGRLVRQRELARDRARTARAASPQRTRTVREQFAPTLPNPTEQNPTEPDQTPDQNPPTPRKRGPREHLPVDEPFIAELVQEFTSTFTERKVRDEVERALNHASSRKWLDKRRGVRDWLKREAGYQAERTPTPIRGGYHQPGSITPPPTAAEEQAAADVREFKRLVREQGAAVAHTFAVERGLA